MSAEVKLAEIETFIEQLRDERRQNIAALDGMALFRLRLCVGKGWPLASDRVWLALTAGAAALQLQLESIERPATGESGGPDVGG